MTLCEYGETNERERKEKKEKVMLLVIERKKKLQRKSNIKKYM